MTSDLVPINKIEAQVSKGLQWATEIVLAAIEDLTPPNAFFFVDVELSAGTRIAHRSLLYVCNLVAIQKRIWEQLGIDEQHRIADSFYAYVSQKFGVSQNPSTVDNYIRVSRTFLLGAAELPEKVFLFGVEEGVTKLLVDENENAYEVPVDAWDVPFSKLLVSVPRVAKGKMEEEDWGLLFNPNVTQGELIDHWRGPRTTPEKRDALYFMQVSGWLAVSDGSRAVPLAELDMDTIENDELAAQGWVRMRAALQVVEEEDF